MSTLSRMGNQMYTQMANGCEKIANGYRYLNDNETSKYLVWPSGAKKSGPAVKFGLRQALATSLSITFIVGTIFRLIGASSIPGLTVGLATGLVSFAHQCYIYANNRRSATRSQSVSLFVYFKCAQSFNNTERTAYALVAKCQTAWNERNKIKVPV